MRDNVVGLCKLFVQKRNDKSTTMKLRGRDTVGGTIIHELSHNICGTLDHEAIGGGDCYGTADCRQLAANAPTRAWYNADNIEYLCENMQYGDDTGDKTLPTRTGLAAIKAAGGWT